MQSKEVQNVLWYCILQEVPGTAVIWKKMIEVIKEDNVYIIEVAFIDTQGGGSTSLNQINILDSLNVALFGVPDGRYKYMSDGVVYDTYDGMMKHVYKEAKAHGQQGAIPMVYHGTVRTDNPILAPGCGFPLYFQILTKTYGIIPAYIYTITGMIFPYLDSPYRNFELLHSPELQYYYNNGFINIDYIQSNVDTSKYYKGLYRIRLKLKKMSSEF